MWVLKLSKANEHFLLSGEWLSDTIVNSSQTYSNIFSSLQWLQDSNLGQILAFDVQSSPFVQMLYTSLGYYHSHHEVWSNISNDICNK